MQAYSGIRQFCSSFQLASNPQIVKLYAAGELEKMQSLLFSVCKLSFFLIFILALPFIVNAHFVLSIWLKEVPAHTETFFILLLIYSFVDVLAYPLDIAAQATGKLKNYSITVSSVVLSTLVFSYIAFSLKAIPESIYIIAILVSCLGIIVRLLFLKCMIKLDWVLFIKDVIIRILLVGLLSAALPVILPQFMLNGMKTVIVSFFLSFVISVAMVYFIGLNKSEKRVIKEMCNKILVKIK